MEVRVCGDNNAPVTHIRRVVDDGCCLVVGSFLCSRRRVDKRWLPLVVRIIVDKTTYSSIHSR